MPGKAKERADEGGQTPQLLRRADKRAGAAHRQGARPARCRQPEDLPRLPHRQRAAEQRAVSSISRRGRLRSLPRRCPNWLGTHISGRRPQRMLPPGCTRPSSRPPRAEKCLRCHFGDATQFVDHRLYGAGHPRLGFELDTFTAISRAFRRRQRYVQRKGRITDVQVWAAGQAAVAGCSRIDALLDPKRGRAACPRIGAVTTARAATTIRPARLPTASGLGPGTSNRMTPTPDA